MTIDLEPKRPIFKTLHQRRAFAEIADQIRQSILSGHLKPGDKLPSERELAIQFGTGRISVREALRTLEQAGLIFIRQGSEGGAFVREVDISLVSESIHDLIRRVDLNLEELIEVRIAIEGLIIDKALKKITPEAMGQLEKTIQEAETLLNRGAPDGGATLDLDLLVATNMDFHLILARAAKNPLLELITESLMKTMNQFLTETPPPLEHLHRHLDYHRSIYRTLVEKDLDSAREQLNRHSLHLQKLCLERAG